MPLEKQIGDAATALTQNQYVDALDGTYWIGGWDATLGAGDLEVDIAPGSGAINGGDVSTGAVQTVDFTGDVDGTEPRKAVISVDDTGTVQKTIGETAPPKPTGEFRFRTYDPAPPATAPGVVVAEVWLDAGVTSLVGDDLRDRRVANQAAEGATPNTPAWVEDPNSPIDFAGTDTASITLAENYDQVMLLAANEDTDANQINMRINGDTGSNYDYTSTDATETTGATEWPIVANTFFGSGPIHLYAGWSAVSVSTSQFGRAGGSDRTHHGSSQAHNSINSIELISVNGNMTEKFVVYGWNAD